MSDTQLKRSLSLPLLFLYGLGTILGAGIYVLAGKVAGESGIYTPHAFILAAVIVSFSANSYAQLSRYYPASAGEAVYVHEAFRRNWLATLTGWAIMFTGIVSAATIAKGFAAYLAVFVAINEGLAILILIVALTALAIWGVNQAVWFAAVLTGVEVLGIVMIISFGIPKMSQLIESYPAIFTFPPLDQFTHIAFGAFLAFYAFIGFEDIVNMAEEVKRPRRTVARAIYLSLFVSTFLYCLTALSLMALLPLDQFIGSSKPFADAAQQHQFISVELITLISLAAITNGALVQIVMAARVMYGMANRNLAPRILATVWARTQTPVVATIIVGLFILVFALLLPITSLAKATSAIVLLIFSLINCALIVIYWRRRHSEATIAIKIIFPLTGLIACLGFLLLQLWNIN